MSTAYPSPTPHPLLTLPDLLNPIFLHLAPRDLRSARHTCTLFHAIIARHALLASRAAERLRLRELRILLLGAPGVGKEKLLERWCDLPPRSRPPGAARRARASVRLSGAWTEGEVWMVEFSAREDWVDDGSVRENMKGRERVGVVVVYDVCDPGSFEVLKTWWRMRRASGLAGGDRARRGEVRKGDVCPPGVMDAKVHEAGDNGGEKGGGSGRPTSVLAVYHRCLSRFAASPPSLHSASASTAVSITGHSAMPLALIATTTRVAGTVSRDVSSSEGEALAQDMDVPFFELSIPEAEMPEKDGRDVEAPLREFWGTYKRKWMQERRENEDEYETRK